MISRRSLLAAAGVGALGSTLSLTGCGSSSDDDGAISVYSWRQEDTEGYQQLFGAFTAANAGITVEFEPFNSTDYDQILATAMKAGDALDVIQLRPYAAGREIIDGGSLAPLDDLPGLSAFKPADLGAVSGSDGKVYGVPLALNALISLYNVDLFEKHKIAEPTTWPEFLDACQKLKSAGIVPIAQSGKAAYLLSILYEAVASAALPDGFVQAAHDGSADFTGPEFRQSVQRVLDLKPFLPDSFIGMADDEARAMFAQGEAAMYINGDYRIKPLLELNAKLNLGYLPSLPDSGSASRLCTFVDGAYAVLADSKHLDDAKKLLAYLASADFGTAFGQVFSRLSPVPGTKPEDDLHVKLADAIASSGTQNLFIEIGGGQPDVKSEFENALQGALGGQITADELFAKTQDAYRSSRS
ncbi:ABC transporter substrate-binding protein [Microlunatus speluncae]|uniref:ABC transporter substrate-binding protein n=1 Tax=Microlunatus speluncae TaxID=2594267 RepID=UPI0012665E9F|nr:extracellular solute-binding protein [Microlunatus speluncae]